MIRSSLAEPRWFVECACLCVCVCVHSVCQKQSYLARIGLSDEEVEKLQKCAVDVDEQKISYFWVHFPAFPLASPCLSFCVFQDFAEQELRDFELRRPAARHKVVDEQKRSQRRTEKVHKHTHKHTHTYTHAHPQFRLEKWLWAVRRQHLDTWLLPGDDQTNILAAVWRTLDPNLTGSVNQMRLEQYLRSQAVDLSAAATGAPTTDSTQTQQAPAADQSSGQPAAGQPQQQGQPGGQPGAQQGQPAQPQSGQPKQTQAQQGQPGQQQQGQPGQAQGQTQTQAQAQAQQPGQSGAQGQGQTQAQQQAQGQQGVTTAPAPAARTRRLALEGTDPAKMLSAITEKRASNSVHFLDLIDTSMLPPRWFNGEFYRGAVAQEELLSEHSKNQHSLLIDTPSVYTITCN